MSRVSRTLATTLRSITPPSGLERVTAGMGQGPHARSRFGVGAPNRVWKSRRLKHQ